MADTPRILLTLPDTAWPVDGGKRLRCAGVLRGLAALGEVDVAVVFSTAPVSGAPIPPDIPVARWERFDPDPMPRPRALAAGVRARVPMHLAAQRWEPVRSALADWSRVPYDLAWFGGIDHAWALRDHVSARARVVDCDDVETEKWRAYLAAPPAPDADRVERLQRRVELPLWARLQREAARWADRVIVCSDLDRDRFGTGRTAVVPNTYPDPGPPPQRPGGPPRMVMVANFHTDQNLDAAVHAVHDVLPHLRALLPDVRLRLVGRGPERLAALRDAPGLDVVGPVDDVGAELTAAHVVVVPMRFGGGTRLKVLEAFAHGVPVVSTALGCEGLAAVDGTHLLVRDDPRDLAEGCRALVTDPARAAAVAAAARELYVRHFRPEAAVHAVRSAVGPLVGAA